MSSEDMLMRLVKIPKRADLVARDLRSWIVRGTLKEGDQLPTLERLAARFGVSIAVVREAVRILETEDLVEIRRGAKGGVTVKTPTQEVVTRSVGLFLQFQKVTVDDLLTARLSMEPFAVARLAARATPRMISELEALIATTEACVNDPLEFAYATTAFNQALVALTGIKTLSVVHTAVLNIVKAESISFAALRGPTSLDNRKKLIRSKYRLLNFIKAGDPTGAEDHWIKHLENSMAALLSLEHGTLIIDLFATPGDGPSLVDLGSARSRASTPPLRRRANALEPAPPKPRAGRRS